MRVGVIDVGSNTARLLVASVSPGPAVDAVADERAFLGLGAEIARNGGVGTDLLRETAETAARFASVARKARAQRLETVVTAPGRQAGNTEELLSVLRAATDAPVRVLSAEEEGRLAYEGAVASASSLPEVVGVVDVGGGSTEIVVGTPLAGAAWTRSFDVGSLRLSRACFATDRPAEAELAAARRAVLRALGDVQPPIPDAVFATGGSSRALGKVLGRRYDADALDEAVRELARRPVADRIEEFGLHPLRAETIVAGAVVLAEVGRLLGRPFELARGGLREGVVIELAALAAAAA
jgi:exopolyphosphatase/guanosine-5'-triphosphate,3'-diphosphate pyrophosphatase